MAAKGDPHSLCPSPQGEFTSREKLQGSHHPPRLCQLAPGSGSRPYAPGHLPLRSGWLWEGPEVSGWVGGKTRRARPKRGCTAAPPLGGAAQAQWPYRRQGAATWRSERRPWGFTTTVALVVAAVALSVASATAGASAPASAVASSALKAFRSGGSTSARRGRAGGREGEREEAAAAAAAQLLSGQRLAARPPPGISLSVTHRLGRQG